MLLNKKTKCLIAPGMDKMLEYSFALWWGDSWKSWSGNSN
jgi:hypothetical protein